MLAAGVGGRKGKNDNDAVQVSLVTAVNASVVSYDAIELENRVFTCYCVCVCVCGLFGVNVNICLWFFFFPYRTGECCCRELDDGPRLSAATRGGRRGSAVYRRRMR